MAEAKRKLAAILSADVAGYSRLMGDDEAATLKTLNAYRAVFREHIAKRDGRVVDTAGDSVLAVFDSVVEAVQCAVDVQGEIAPLNADLSEHRRMLFRIGVNLGDVIEQDDGTVYGDGVNIAARLEALAEPGGACVSEAAHMQIEGKLDVRLEDLGRHEVKNIAKPVRVYGVRPATGEPAPALSEPSATPPDKPSIAVLPFTNMSGDPEQEYFADGITEDIITELSHLRNLRVIARHSVFAYKGKAVDLRRVGRDLGVRHVLEGSVRKARDRVRVTAQLIDAQTGDHLWAQRYDRELTDNFDLQDEITRAIVTELDVKLVEGDVARVWRRSTTSYGAYDLLLRGIAEHQKFTREGQARARALFEQALEEDPRFAVAMAILGLTLWTEAVCGWSEAPLASLDEALKWVERALVVDDKLGHTHSILGLVSLARGEHDAGIAALEQGVALDQTDRSRMYFAGGLCWVERSQEALKLIEEAIISNPNPPAWYKGARVVAHFCAGSPEKTIAALGDVPGLAPQLRVYLALAYQSTSRSDDARRHAKELLLTSPHFSSDVFFASFKNPGERDRMIALAKAAGLP